jgi:hypothetical protein
MSTDGENWFTRIHRAWLPVWLVLLTDWTSGRLSNPSMSTANEMQPGMLLFIDRANSVGGVTLGFDHGIKAKVFERPMYHLAQIISRGLRWCQLASLDTQ